MSPSKSKLDVRIKRAYEPSSTRDGVRVLVDGLWPRGRSKRQLAIERWMKEIAPSAELRRWFGHDPAKWSEFQHRYRAELKDKPELLAQLRAMAAAGPLTLVYSARDEQHNQAVVLRQTLCK